jgi:hypothetical protein
LMCKADSSTIPQHFLLSEVKQSSWQIWKKQTNNERVLANEGTCVVSLLKGCLGTPKKNLRIELWTQKGWGMVWKSS